ncbi:alanine--tRNA ligase [Anaeromicropila herbilytica]|uniref:alanine--tRNA ligase n=1 Tax=Anaeromicropila herbilytica TaxID=2785025 RepID=A0A7R7ID74_9FIRM|nr:alanine--tRNA ligase [Anaeromicropila herbilytica]BCN30739.1 alanine--tRNA ligase [Anaeromicropila herbilytica]
MMKMTPDELRKSYIDFMKRIGASQVPSSSLLPENDPSTLFTGSGMQPMVPYLLGEKHPIGNELTNIQKCLRTVDIDEVGDMSHLTFFEMIGRWEFKANENNYKKKQIDAIWNWQINELGIDPSRLYISAFKGSDDMNIPRDTEAIQIWSEKFKSVGIEPIIEEDPYKYGSSRGGKIFLYNEEENWWSRAGSPFDMPVGEPGGPDSEMFYDLEPDGDSLDHPASESERFLEIGNNVFMCYKKENTGFEKMQNPNIDYGGGLERVATALNGDRDIYNTAFFHNSKKKLMELSGKEYTDDLKSFRIILDHVRAATFLINDGAEPANSDAGYITRRLLRRAIRAGKKIGIQGSFVGALSEVYIDEAAAYEDLIRNKKKVIEIINKEENLFYKTLQQGEIEIQKHLKNKGKVTGADAFYFYETYGFPLELTKEFLTESGYSMEDEASYVEAAKKHAEMSRTASAGKFKGGLADQSTETTALHTVAHLLLAGLREVLGDHVHQKGSNITSERLRFDFNHDEKLTPEQIAQVEKYVNDAISSNAVTYISEMPKTEAKESGVEGNFWDKYPDVVKVYTIKDNEGNVWSREVCGGPHIEDTTSLGTFSIKKEQSSSAGVRRIKGIICK